MSTIGRVRIQRLLASALLLACTIAPAFAATPRRDPPTLGPEALALVRKAFEGLDPALPILDCHVHLIGNGKGQDGIEVNPSMFSPKHPLKRLAAKAYIRASGAADTERFDEAYVARLAELARAFGRPIRIHILAMDHAYTSEGTLDREHTEFYVPNEYVVRVARQHPDLFVPVVSIHPARPDAIAELEKWAAQGVRWVKWLPNAQCIDPAEPEYDPFYRRMAALGVVLLTHTGEERAVSSEGAQALGNPLRMRRALDAGVTVVMAHCASLGRNRDLDNPGMTSTNFELFLRMMGEERYRGRLFGDSSAMTQVNRLPGPILELLRRPELQGRLLNGSDYPLPAIDCVIWTRLLVRMGLITPVERKALNAIFRANPLLFDFVLKRTLRDPRTGIGLEPRMFQERPGPPSAP